MTETSFWKRPEGKLGLVIGAVLLAGLAFVAWSWVLPFVLKTMISTFWLGVYATGTAALVYAVFIDNSLRTLVGNFYKRLIRGMYVLSFNVDPIGGLKERIKELRQRNAFARDEAGKVKAQAVAVQKTIDENNTEAEQNLRLMETAKAHGRAGEAQAMAVTAGFARDANKQLKPLKERMDRSFTVLQDIIEKSDLQVTMLEAVVRIKERTYQSAKAGRSALKAAMAAFRGDTEKDSVFQMNLDYIDDFASQAVGEMDSMLALNQKAIDSVDLQQQSFSDDAWDELDKRQESVRHLLSESEPARQLLSGQFQPGYSAEVQVNTRPANADDDFAQLFTRKDR